MPNKIILKKYNGKEIDIADPLTRYYLGMKDKNFQALWMKDYLVQGGHDKQNITFEFYSENESTYLVYFSDNIEFNNAFIIETKSKYIDYVGIFIPGKTYFWKVIDSITLDESEIDSFKILNTYVRWISAGRVFNMRDLGGWDTTDNKKVRYGYIYRGGQLKLDNKWEKSYMDEYAYQVFDYLNIKTEIELRGGFDHKLSQIHDDTLNIYVNGIGYEQILSMDNEQKEQYRKLFASLANKDNYPLYFHCSWGADRTGVLAFLISGILGVSYESICEDYELTSLSGSGRRSRISFPWKDMLPELINKYGNKKLYDILYDYLTDYIGVKQEEIALIRELLLEDNDNNANTHTVTYRINGNTYLETNVFDGACISYIEPITSLDKSLNCWTLNGVKFDFNTKVKEDIVLDALFDDITFEDYDTISLSDLGLGKSYNLIEAKDYSYNNISKTGSRMFSFDYKIEANDGKFDDGVHIEIGTLWSYKAHIWLQNQDYQHVYIDNYNLSISYSYKLEYAKTYRIDVGVLIPKNGVNKGKKLLVLKINGIIISIVETFADLDVYSIGLAGTKGILYNVKDSK